MQFLAMVYSLWAGSRLMLKNWKLDPGVYEEGRMWDVWVQSISELMEHHGLPVTARKDTRKPGQMKSPFVSLITALNERLPKELCRHNTKEALPAAVNHARKSNWWFPPPTRNLSEDEKAFLDTPDQRTDRSKKFKERLANDPNWIQRGPGSFISVAAAALEEKRNGPRTAVGADKEQHTKKTDPKTD